MGAYIHLIVRQVKTAYTRPKGAIETPARGISDRFYPVTYFYVLEVQPQSYGHGVWTHLKKCIAFQLPASFKVW